MHMETQDRESVSIDRHGVINPWSILYYFSVDRIYCIVLLCTFVSIDSYEFY